jgi:hypothetical protein
MLQYSMYRLLSLFKPEALCKLFTCVMLEKQILLRSKGSPACPQQGHRDSHMWIMSVTYPVL